MRIVTSCESSARQMIRMKCHALFSLKKKKNKNEKEMLTAAFVIGTLRFRNIKWLLNVVSEVKRVLRQLWTLQMLTGLLIFAIAPDKRQILLVFMSPHRHLWGGGQLDFGADPVGIGIGVSMTLSCLHNILWTSDLEKLKIHGGGWGWGMEGGAGGDIYSLWKRCYYFSKRNIFFLFLDKNICLLRCL